MVSTPDMSKMYRGIHHQLSNLIPEKWESIYLYASVIKQISNIETWEMYFYYVPAGILKKNPINVYEIPSRFNVDEEEYLSLVDTLCHSIKKLYKEYQKTYQRDCTNLVIAIKGTQFLIEYNDDNLAKSKYNSNDRHLIFKYKYLNIPLQSFQVKERRIIQSFLENEESKMQYDRYFEIIEKEQTRNYIEYERDTVHSEDVYSSQLATREKKESFFSIIFRKIFGRVRGRKRMKSQKDSIEGINTIEPIKIESAIQIISDK